MIKAAASDGQVFGFSDVHADRLARYQRRVVRWQRTAARRDKGGRNRHKANQRVARYKQAQAHIRGEFAHQTSHQLVSDPRHLLFVFEALKLQNMTRSAKGTPGAPGTHVKAKAGLNRALLESALGQTRRYTEYKARRAGKLAIDVPPFNSSRECRVCGHVHQDNRLTQALFVCQACGHTENADTNASCVIQARGVDLILSGQWKVKEKKRCAIRKQVGRDSPEPALETAPTLTEFSVRRETGNGLARGTSMWEALATVQRT